MNRKIFVLSQPSSSSVSDIQGLQEALDDKATVNHQHQINNIDDLQNVLNSKAPTNHQHQINDINDLQVTLDAKASTNHGHNFSDIAELPESLDNIQYSVQDIYDKLDNKEDKGSVLPWSNLQLLNGWSNFGGGYVSAQYRKIDLKTIEIRGIIKKAGSFVNNEVVAILPENHRPYFTTPMGTTSQNRDCRIVIETTGEIRVRTGSNSDTSISCIFGL